MDMGSRVNRANLDRTKKYIRVRTENGVVIEKPVGFFMRSYRMGSGDGTTIHWEFMLDGKITVENDEMYGSVNGTELTWFKEVEAEAEDAKKSCDTPCDFSSCSCK
jgi:hypothetical protein